MSRNWIWTAIILAWSFDAKAFHLGVGYSTLTSGRMVPALNLGFEVGNYMLTGMSSGVATKAYYSSLYSLSALHQFSFGSHWFGKLNGGIGIGGVYGKKGLAENLPEEPEEVIDHSDEDFGLGPAFRIGINPLNNFFVAFDYVLMLGQGISGNGWGDTGIFSFGLEI